MLMFRNLAIKPDEFQLSLLIIQQNSKMLRHIIIVCITLLLIAPVSTDVQATPPFLAGEKRMSALQEKACNTCLQVLIKLEYNESHIWKTCDFCLELLELEPDAPTVAKKIKQIKKRLLYKRMNALKKLFRYEKILNLNEQSGASKNVEINRVLNNIIAILEYLIKINEMFDTNDSQETDQINSNIEKYNKLLN